MAVVVVREVYAIQPAIEERHIGYFELYLGSAFSIFASLLLDEPPKGVQIFGPALFDNFHSAVHQLLLEATLISAKGGKLPFP